jgi:hypothetical protein
MLGMQEMFKRRWCACVVAARGELRAEYSKNDFMEGFIFLTKGSAMLSLFYLWDL